LQKKSCRKVFTKHSTKNPKPIFSRFLNSPHRETPKNVIKRNPEKVGFGLLVEIFVKSVRHGLFCQNIFRGVFELPLPRNAQKRTKSDCGWVGLGFSKCTGGSVDFFFAGPSCFCAPPPCGSFQIAFLEVEVSRPNCSARGHVARNSTQQGFYKGIEKKKALSPLLAQFWHSPSSKISCVFGGRSSTRGVDKKKKTYRSPKKIAISRKKRPTGLHWLSFIYFGRPMITDRRSKVSKMHEKNV
jgi:hypothetical protein